jgi:hypothetical protein
MSQGAFSHMVYNMLLDNSPAPTLTQWEACDELFRYLPAMLSFVPGLVVMINEPKRLADLPASRIGLTLEQYVAIIDWSIK